MGFHKLYTAELHTLMRRTQHHLPMIVENVPPMIRVWSFIKFFSMALHCG
jgi:hypothetical protein